MRKIAELQRLDGRAAMVVGGAGHVGRAVAEVLLELGAKVVIADRDSEACRRRCDELIAWGASDNALVPLAVDISDEGCTRDAVHTAAGALGGLDVLVHTAAFVGTTRHPGWAVDFSEQTAAAFDVALRVNLTSAFVLAQEARPYLERGGRGAIVLTSSVYAMVAADLRLYEGTTMANPVAYGASKAGLLQLVRSLATLFAPSIRVNAVTPGGIERQQPDVFVERYVARTPLQRMATEEDLKGAFAFLCSDLSAYVTGQNVVVDGGFTCW